MRIVEKSLHQCLNLRRWGFSNPVGEVKHEILKNEDFNQSKPWRFTVVKHVFPRLCEKSMRTPRGYDCQTWPKCSSSWERKVEFIILSLETHFVKEEIYTSSTIVFHKYVLRYTCITIIHWKVTIMNILSPMTRDWILWVFSLEISVENLRLLSWLTILYLTSCPWIDPLGMLPSSHVSGLLPMSAVSFTTCLGY